MMAYPDMLVEAANKVGIKVPENPDKWVEEMKEFPHFYAFCITQLGRPLVYWGEHWENAKVISQIPEGKILGITMEDLLEMGLIYPAIKG